MSGDVRPSSLLTGQQLPDIQSPEQPLDLGRVLWVSQVQLARLVRPRGGLVPELADPLDVAVRPTGRVDDDVVAGLVGTAELDADGREPDPAVAREQARHRLDGPP